jgi:hypothetical protein
LLRRGIERALVLVSRFSVFHPRTVIVAATLLTAGALWLASGLSLSTRIETLLPEGVPAAERLQGLMARYGSSEPIVVAISSRTTDPSETIEDRIDLALTLSDLLAESEQLHGVSGLFGEDPARLLSGPEAAALLLTYPPGILAPLVEGIDREEIERRVAENLRQLRSPLGPAATALIAEDPLGLLRPLVGQLRRLKGNLRIDSQDGVLLTEDREYVLLLVRAAGPTSDFAHARRVLEEVQAVARAALDELGLAGTVGIGPAPPLPDGPPLHVGLTGAPAILVDYREILARDIRTVSVGAFIAVMVLFLFAFRRGTALLVAGVPLVVGVLWALAFAAITVGEISVFTAGSVAILCGLAIDFTIHLYNRYLEEVHAGFDMASAFATAHGETGLGILAAAATTTWAFMAAGFSSFRGLRDLGIVCAAGVVLSLVASLLLVPALTALAARIKPGPDRIRGLAGFGLGPILTVVVRRAGVVSLIGLALTVGLGVAAFRVHLDEDFSRFRPTSAPSIQLQEALATRTNTSLQPVIALVPGDSVEHVLDRAARLGDELAPLVGGQDPLLAAVLGPSALLPSPDRQQQALDILARARGEGLEPAEVERELLAAMEEQGFRIDARARRAAERVRRMLAREQPLVMEEVAAGPLGEILDQLVIPGEHTAVEGIVSAYPVPGIRSSELIPAMRAAVEASGVPAQLVGARVLSQELRPLILRDAGVAVLLSAAGVLIILGLSFRRPLLVVLTFVPLAVGLIAAVGVMSLLRIDFNLVSLTMIPLVLGIGIDNGIHVVHRFIVHTSEDLVEVFQHTGRGIVMTSLTTMVGFGALVFADYPGLISSGVLAILGVGATLVTAVTLLPAFLKLVHARELTRARRG